MNNNTTIKIIIFGIVQWITLNITIFAVSLVFGISEGTEMTAPTPIGFLVIAVIAAVISWALVRRINPANRKQDLIIGLVWSGMMFAFMAAITFANGTTAAIFGNWGAYLALIAPGVGPFFTSPTRLGASGNKKKPPS